MIRLGLSFCRVCFFLLARCVLVLSDARVRAVCTGLALGLLVWAMARFGDARLIASGWAGAVAVVMVVAAGAAFTLHAMHLDGRGRPAGASVAPARVRQWVSLLCAACLVALGLLSRLP